MADTKITALTAISTVDPAVDVLPIVDVSDTTMAARGTTKKITSNQILGAGGTATLASATITGDLTVDTSTLKVDSANNRVGIGTATPANTLEVVAPAGDNIVSTFRSGDVTAANNAGGGFRSISSATAASRVAQVWLDADGANFSGGDYFYIQKNGNSGTVEFNQSSNAAMTFLTNSTERMRIESGGNLLVGTTSALASGSTFQNLGSARQVLTLKNDDSTSYTLGLWSATTTGDNFFAYFGTETTLTVRGAISYNRAGGLVAYNTTSDYRAKDIIGPVSNSGSLIDSLKVYVGKMKGATVERPMLIAHEAQDVAPYAVTGTKDEVDADGNPKYQQMDVSSLVPLLIAEIQSLRTRVAALEA